MSENISEEASYVIQRTSKLPLASQKNPRYVVKESDTDKIVDDAGGFGYKSEETAKRGWKNKSRGMSVKKRRAYSKAKIEEFLKENPGLKEDLEDELFLLYKLNIKTRTLYLTDHFYELEDLDERKVGFTVSELINYLS